MPNAKEHKVDENGNPSPPKSKKSRKKQILRSLTPTRFQKHRNKKPPNRLDSKGNATEKIKRPPVRARSFGLGSGTVTNCSEQLVFFETPSEGLQLVQYEDVDDEGTVIAPLSVTEEEETPEQESVPSTKEYDYSTLSDAELLKALEEAVDYEKHVLVARYLQEMERRDLKLDDPKRQAALKHVTEQVQEIIDSHSQDASDKQYGWKKQGLMQQKHRNTMVYHRTNKAGEVTVRCETPIQATTVAPLLAILNETDLYTTWCPSFQRPFKLGVSDTGRHMQCSRASQVAYAKVDMPWPMNNREVIVKNVMAEAVDEIGALVVRAKTMDHGEEEEGFTVPPCEPGWDRIQMDAGLLLQKCPPDHPALKKKQNGEDSEPMVLATFTLFVAPSINTILKVIAGPMWGALIGFASDVESGKTGEQHRKRIEETPELYGWVSDVVKRMQEACK